MTRRKFLALTTGSAVIGGTAYYLQSDRKNVVRDDLLFTAKTTAQLQTDELEILYLASLAPSGHNTQPWFIKRMEPLTWIICNDKTKWLPAVDPEQRETILSIGAFLQNLEYAAHRLGYHPECFLMANANQDENVMEVKLTRTGTASRFNIDKITQRRTVRSNILTEPLKQHDIDLLIDKEPDLIHFVPRESETWAYLNDQTIEANKLQAYRDVTQNELADWIRFSNADATRYRDGLTPATMEIEGISGWLVRNFYHKKNVMSKTFRDEGINQVIKQVGASAGWFLITSRGASVGDLIETGMRMQRLFLKVRDRNIAIHPMTQILEEPTIRKSLNVSIGINEPVQFLLRTGYVTHYPDPVSLRRPVDWLIRYMR